MTANVVWDFHGEHSAWTCDKDDCQNTDTGGSNGFRDLRDYMPEGWSAVLITSIDDGDYDLVLCPTHTRQLKHDAEPHYSNRNLTGRHG
jgi:hypothetical protein